MHSGGWTLEKPHARRLSLSVGEKSDEEGFILLYIPEQKRYAYDSMRRLLSIQGRGQGKLIIHYQENYISQIVTSAGYILEFQYEERKCTA